MSTGGEIGEKFLLVKISGHLLLQYYWLHMRDAWRKLCCRLFFFIIIHVRLSFITGSYDRTCKVWDTMSGEELLTLEGHKNVVYAIAYNNPYG